jgi:hypothetical protein
MAEQILAHATKKLGDVDIVFLGKRRNNSQLMVTLVVESPVVKAFPLDTSKFEDRNVNYNRVYLSPDLFGQGYSVMADRELLWQDFINEVTQLSSNIKAVCGRETENWKDPFYEMDGRIEGVAAKYKTSASFASYLETSANVFNVVLRVNCAYFGVNRSGISFEIVELCPVAL